MSLLNEMDERFPHLAYSEQLPLFTGIQNTEVADLVADICFQTFPRKDFDNRILDVLFRAFALGAYCAYKMHHKESGWLQ